MPLFLDVITAPFHLMALSIIIYPATAPCLCTMYKNRYMLLASLLPLILSSIYRVTVLVAHLLLLLMVLLLQH